MMGIGEWRIHGPAVLQSVPHMHALAMVSSFAHAHAGNPQGQRVSAIGTASVVAALVVVGGHIHVACWVFLDTDSMWSVGHVMLHAGYRTLPTICGASVYLFSSFLFFFMFEWFLKYVLDSVRRNVFYTIIELVFEICLYVF